MRSRGCDAPLGKKEREVFLEHPHPSLGCFWDGGTPALSKRLRAALEGEPFPGKGDQCLLEWPGLSGHE